LGSESIENNALKTHEVASRLSDKLQKSKFGLNSKRHKELLPPCGQFSTGSINSLEEHVNLFTMAHKNRTLQKNLP